MISIKTIINNRDDVIKNLKKRNQDYSKEIDQIVELNKKMSLIQQDLNQLQETRNKISKQIGILINQKKVNEVENFKKTIETNNLEIFNLKKQYLELEEKITKLIDIIPNLIEKSVPIGKDENNNILISKFGIEPKFLFKLKSYYDLAVNNNLIDFIRGAKLSGSRYAIYVDNGAKLLNALLQFMLEKQMNNNYTYLIPPVIVDDISMYSSGHLPKFASEAYQLKNQQWLIPTGEVPLVNYYRNEIIDELKLPIKFVTYTNCFRSEAGSAGKDTKGIIRMHQFNKVELVKLLKPEDDLKELNLMIKDASSILEDLNLPYQIIELCGGDLGFSSQKTYDLEVWFPFEKKYREISSISSCSDFQARRAKIRYRNKETKKTEYVFTQNGSGIALDRCLAAIIENYQTAEGKIKVPEKLKKYLNNQDFL